MLTNTCIMKKLVLFYLILFTINGHTQLPCNPLFSYAINQGNVTFQAQNTAPGKVHFWRFGDGQHGYGFSVNKTYTNSGTYSVVHIVSDSLSSNCLDSSVQSVNVTVPTNCQALFTVASDPVIRNRRHFTSVSTTGSGTIQSYNWSVNGNPVSSINNLSYSFNPGTHNVCLSIISSSGCTSSSCQTITVNDTSGCNLTAGFTATPVSGNSQLINFVPSPLASHYSYYWNFGNGEESNSPAPTYFYNPGSYNVSLWIWDSLTGCIDSLNKAVTISGSPQYSCTANFTYTVSSSGLVNLTALSNQPITSAYWQIFVAPDSVFFTGVSPSWQAPGNGLFPACLHINTNNGCISQHCGIIQVDSINTGRIDRIPAYPNPAVSETVRWYVTLDMPGLITYRIFNANGFTMYQSRVVGIAGTNTLIAPVQQLSSGQYFADIQYGSYRKRSIFIKP